MINNEILMSDIDQIKESIDKMDVVSKILKIKKYVEDTPVGDWQMDRITDYMLLLCSLMYNLSDLKDYAYIKAEALSEEYKDSVRKEYISLKEKGEKVTDTMARALAEDRAEYIREKELKAEYQARQLKSLYDDSNRLISYTQTKVKSVADNEIRSKIERR
ncbi:MAG: hypothetical protein EWM47_12125 [Anaerolineaceae bacterium]|jgi:hypothetical protein|nr:MAG: hypothetical protein EWM47_12125 [Anaerolineaceae bacterium]